MDGILISALFALPKMKNVFSSYPLYSTINENESGGNEFNLNPPEASVLVKPSKSESLKRTAKTEAFSIGFIPVESYTLPVTFIFCE
jgi:hypothetical protein